MCKVLVFAGTTEGRKIAEYLDRHHVPAHVCVATEYGESLLPESASLSVSHERLNQEQMTDLMRRLSAPFVVDATHPYAAEVTKNIQAAARDAGVSYIRLLRESAAPDADAAKADVIYADTVEDAVSRLEGTHGNILVTTGSKEIGKFTKLTNYRERVYARVLSLPKVAEQCASLGFEGKHLICMQGPFSQEMNQAMLCQFDCAYMVTKEAGTTGGFLEKYQAAVQCGCKLVIVGRPAKEEGLSLGECKRFLQQNLGFSTCPKITLVGIGMGSAESFTVEGKKACEDADLLIGAQRMVDAALCAAREQGEPDVYVEYRSEEIARYIQEHPQYENIVIALSGDVGYYSGAKKLYQALSERNFTDVHAVAGISSMIYFMARIGKSWDDAAATSLHGRNANIIDLVQKHKKVFAILGTRDGVAALAKKLKKYGMDQVILHVGENLSYPEEKILSGRPEEFLSYESDVLSVVCLENPDPDRKVITHGIPDEAFLRDKVPMTKEEVRSISLSKLRLTEDAVCYDIGAGTGSVSIEMALQASKGHVYAIEKKETAVELLWRNQIHFRVDNMTVVEGLAPEAMDELEVPTHAFIGGSSGNMKQIMEVLLAKNPKVRMVINCIALETVAETLRCVKELPVTDVDIVSVSAARAKTLGAYHMMMGENPIYIISCTGGEAS
ncbi:MAG: precorrin-6A reductase [Lachnospiraceae bacterium]|jgi:precorrin-6Y C5,15-methyltransferase (decarboxylating)